MAGNTHIWHPFTPLAKSAGSLKVVSAKDAELMLDTGNRLIDAISSWWVITHGHANPQIAEAISKQVHKLDHVLFAGFTHEPAEELVELLSPHIPIQKPYFYFSDNGSTSVEVAVKLAWQYWKNRGQKKQVILAFEGAYHGDTFGSMSVSGRSGFTTVFNELLFEVKHVPLPTEQNFAEQRIVWKEICEQQNVAAFIYEPLLQGAAGMRMYSAAHLNEYVKIARQHQIVCIADEVMTGFGRTGKMLASDYTEEKPDIICLSKGITGGVLPLGLTVIAGQIAGEFLTSDKDKMFFHGHSFTANPISCAAACANVRLFTPEVFKRIESIENQHRDFSKKVESDATIKHARSLGSVLAVEIKDNSPGYNAAIRDRMYEYFIKKGLLLRPLGNVLYVLPPYCITSGQLNNIYEEISQFITSEITH